MASKHIYRVVVQTTGRRESGGTHWERQLLYCGESLRNARIAYLRSEAEDHDAGQGRPARRTLLERHAAEPADIGEVEPERIEVG